MRKLCSRVEDERAYWMSTFDRLYTEQLAGRMARGTTRGITRACGRAVNSSCE